MSELLDRSTGHRWPAAVGEKPFFHPGASKNFPKHGPTQRAGAFGSGVVELRGAGPDAEGLWPAKEAEETDNSQR